ncbi:C45 family peptidase [Flavobacterium sp. H122]|uniref:C45 family autoproteolytic acyltransferase/hydolase n=1 Tax=Flavobacterium sp. H122 TaxID=2529860 RepID=UPI0010A9F629|nr:C45 family peptidase [Flavobacterium sp. H122]
MKRRIQILFFIGIVFLFFSCGISKSIHHKPHLIGYDNKMPDVKKHSDSLFTSDKNFLIKNKQNIWELYIEGDPLQRGLLHGSLAKNMVEKQERVFFSRIEDLVPSKFRQKLLRHFLKWYNRKLYLNIPEEYKTEIYGISQFSSDRFNNIAPKYLRSLYLHGAHDIGHAMQDLALVGCSSMAVWGNKTDDGELLIGRNFDFYAGDEFAQDKMISFVKPDKGYPFMSVGWAGMTGVVSGMNNEGLTVTINAGKSKIPLVAKTPISIVAREILQYASTIQEAVEIAKKSQVFVSESIMIGSAKDKKAVLIEVSPKNFGVYEVQNSNQLVCSNHFQSSAYREDKRNQKHIKESHSMYRFERMNELLVENNKMNPQKMVQILRNREGLNDKEIGYGNEKALNQLLAHHSVVFKPESKLVWVSTNPYQLGQFVAYDLNEIFKDKPKDFVVLENESLAIQKEDFVNSKAFADYEKFRIQDRIVDDALKNDKNLDPNFIKEYQELNPHFWVVYTKTGKYYFGKKLYKEAKVQFEKALTKEITTVPDKLQIEKYLRKIKRKIQ